MVIIAIIFFVLFLSIIVLIHEFGHFYTAKKFGIKVEEFGFGFPPRLFGIRKGETLYSINLLPIGGFVKLYGEDEAGGGSLKVKDHASRIKDVKRAYFSRPAWQRAVVIVAGVIMNFLLGAAIFYVFLFISNFKTDLPLLAPHTFFLVNQKQISAVYISEIAKNSPAEEAGIEAPARIVKFDGKAVEDLDQFIKTVQTKRGEKVVMEWQELKTGKMEKKAMVPRINPPGDEGALGIGLGDIKTVVLSYDTPAQKLFSGFTHSINIMYYNIVVMAKLVSVSFQTQSIEPVGQGVSGPFGVFKLVETILAIPDVKEKVLQGLNLAGILSVSLAFFNILPIPALDGGRLFFILIEMAAGRKLSARFEAVANAVGLAALLTLMVLVSIYDIIKIMR